MSHIPDGEDDYSLRTLEDGDPHYIAIGKVAYSWSKLEALLDGFITDLLRGEDDATQCVIAQLIGPAPRVRAMIALARLRGGSEGLVTDMNKFGRECTEIGTKRNRVVHDMVCVSMTTGRSFKILGTADKKLEYGWRLVTDDDMKKVLAEIEDLIEVGRQLFFRMTFEIGTGEQKKLLQQLGILPLHSFPS